MWTKVKPDQIKKNQNKQLTNNLLTFHFIQLFKSRGLAREQTKNLFSKNANEAMMF
jgi:hypothetical protein